MDFIYLKRLTDPRVGRLDLRVKLVGSGGRLVPEGRDKKTVKDHVENRAPCHLSNLDIWQNPGLTRGDVDLNCQVCHRFTDGSTTLLCNGCDGGWHRTCLDSPLLATPVGNWSFPRYIQGMQDLAYTAFIAS